MRVPEVRGDANISFVRPSLKRSVIAWLLDSDPSICWQVMRDLTDASAEEVAAERSRWNTLRALRVLNWYNANGAQRRLATSRTGRLMTLP